MSSNKLVSIITPCYNTERYIKRLLNSVLSQTYRPIEFIAVNDGSTDRTEEIVRSYESLFREASIRFKYIAKENGGVASAICTGLGVFTGDYLVWPDSDDFMCSNLIEKMVDFLENNPKYGLVRTNIKIFLHKNNGNLKYRGTLVSPHDKYASKEDLFDTFVFQQKGCWLEPGGYMIRTNIFLEANPSRYIYPSRGGQNFQILLPVLHRSKCGYINEPLHNYVIRNDSHSRQIYSFKDTIDRCNIHEDILLNTIKSIDGIDVSKYENLITAKHHRERFKIACNYRNKTEAKRYLLICRNSGSMTAGDYLRLIIYQFYPCRCLYDFLRRIRSILIGYFSSLIQ
jgi:glycosyltransferase involved in cell wall biosynthesis